MVVPQLLLDPIPVVGVFFLVVAINLVFFEVGFRFGRSRKDRDEGGSDDASGSLAGSMLALLAFLLAVTMSMAADRFDTRRGLVLAEATTIETAYLRAGYLAEPYRTDTRNLLREYVPLRIAGEGGAHLVENILRSEDMHQELWAQAEGVATEYGSDVTALFVESINEIITIHSNRITAGIYARVPDTVILFLLVLAGVSIGMVGFNAGVAGRRHILSAGLVIVALAAVITLVVDLDRPRDGFLQVSQRPLIELEQQIGPPEP